MWGVSMGLPQGAALVLCWLAGTLPRLLCAPGAPASGERHEQGRGVAECVSFECAACRCRVSVPLLGGAGLTVSYGWKGNKTLSGRQGE